MSDVDDTIVDSIAIVGAILIGIFLIVVSVSNTSLFNNTEYDSMINSVLVIISSVIAYTLGKRRSKS
ncbi:hypothetical protein [Deltalipothrixvirus pozzuoliense]|uniref:Putative transmembrane protein ORF66 n=1 Tax=Acidianus filamentous virus 2 (isolate Italy/Pozzuoli) TaxID=654910 RepID=Y066_AFV2P|nr:hypothetical protein AFV2_gp19 [Acidianus filamentous virus 2]Q573F0.1 RecName: Full=Putative transmembrane protein ORF66 [Acidianus filamentous virus 2 (isolate Pozzuoli)]CAH69406.1 hypothetical protein [Acidianus filamentous virus 2]